MQFDLQLVNNIYPVMTKDSLLTSHAISTPIKDPDDIPQFFDSISYDKVKERLMIIYEVKMPFAELTHCF